MGFFQVLCMAQGLFVVDLVPAILVVGVEWKTQVTEVTGVDYLIEETLGHTRNVGIALGTSDCLVVIGKASVMRLFLRITGMIATVLVAEVRVSLFVMGLICKLWAIRLTL